MQLDTITRRFWPGRNSLARRPAKGSTIQGCIRRGRAPARKSSRQHDGVRRPLTPRRRSVLDVARHPSRPPTNQVVVPVHRSSTGGARFFARFGIARIWADSHFTRRRHDCLARMRGFELANVVFRRALWKIAHVSMFLETFGDQKLIPCAKVGCARNPSDRRVLEFEPVSPSNSQIFNSVIGAALDILG